MELPNPHQQILTSHSMEEALLMVCPKSHEQQQQERKARPQPEHALKCPRCASTNTKFCYYNNYSLTQPRYFCKGCKRYWTQGGSLRNVPVGGGCRKINKRSSSSSSSSSAKKAQDQNPSSGLLPSLSSLIPPHISYDPNDLTLAFAASLQKQAPPASNPPNHSLLLGHPSPDAVTAGPPSGFLDMLRSTGGFVDQASGSCPSGLNTLFYGFGVNGEDQGILSSEGGVAAGRTVTRQGSSKDMDEADHQNNKVFMAGLPWQVASNGDHVGSSMAMVESGRDFWSTAASGVSSSWHGLINNPLM